MRCSKERRQRLTEAVEAALRIGGGTVAIESIKLPEDNFEFSEIEIPKQNLVKQLFGQKNSHARAWISCQK